MSWSWPSIRIVKNALVPPPRPTAKQCIEMKICIHCKLGEEQHLTSDNEDGTWCPKTQRDKDVEALYGSLHTWVRYEPMDNLEILRYAAGEEVKPTLRPGDILLGGEDIRG